MSRDGNLIMYLYEVYHIKTGQVIIDKMPTPQKAERFAMDLCVMVNDWSAYSFRRIENHVRNHQQG